MQDLLNNSAFLALLATIFGGAGVKLIESWLGKAKERSTQEQGMRDELRKEIDSLRTQLANSDKEEQRLETLVDEWKAKYYDLRDEKSKVVTDLSITLERLKALEAALAAKMEE